MHVSIVHISNGSGFVDEEEIGVEIGGGRGAQWCIWGVRRDTHIVDEEEERKSELRRDFLCGRQDLKALTGLGWSEIGRRVGGKYRGKRALSSCS